MPEFPLARDAASLFDDTDEVRLDLFAGDLDILLGYEVECVEERQEQQERWKGGRQTLPHSFPFPFRSTTFSLLPFRSDKPFKKAVNETSMSRDQMCRASSDLQDPLLYSFPAKRRNSWSHHETTALPHTDSLCLYLIRTH